MTTSNRFRTQNFSRNMHPRDFLGGCVITTTGKSDSQKDIPWVPAMDPEPTHPLGTHRQSELDLSILVLPAIQIFLQIPTNSPKKIFGRSYGVLRQITLLSNLEMPLIRRMPSNPPGWFPIKPQRRPLLIG